VADYETIQRRRNITVGIFVFIALWALVWLIHKFEDLPLRLGAIRSYEVYVQFPTAAGVQDKTPVKFCGVQIGTVSRIQPPMILKDLNTGQFYYQALVILRIDGKYDQIPANVEVKLLTRGLGSSYIDFRTKTFDVKEPSGPFLKRGSLLQGQTGRASEFFPEESQRKLEELAESLNILAKSANEIIGDKANQQNINETLANLSIASKEATLAAREMKNFMAAGIQTGEKLNEAAEQLRVVLSKINTGQGTASKLLNDGRLYEGLLETSQQLKLLLQEMDSFLAHSKEKGLPIKLK